MGGAPTLKTKSVKFNFMMNMILTVSSFVFPLITFPYVSRVLLVEGNGYVSFATSVLTYFTMFASLGIPSYGIRACAQVRDDRKELSRVTQELFIINIITTIVVSIVFVITLFTVPQFKEQQTLLWINGASLILNAVGVNWFYSAMEQYSYITVRSIIFKIASIILMFIFVRQQKDYIIYGAITVFATSGSNLLNFVNLRKFIDLKPVGNYRFKRHLKPILYFFAASAATQCLYQPRYGYAGIYEYTNRGRLIFSCCKIKDSTGDSGYLFRHSIAPTSVLLYCKQNGSPI